MWKQIMATALMIVLLAACSDPVEDPRDNLTGSKQLDSEPVGKTVGVYVDTTPSMKGFTAQDTEDRKNYYSLCLKEIDAMISAGYGGGQISYYRVDTPLWETSENVLLKALREDYYVNSAYFLPLADYQKIGEDEGYQCPCLTRALESGLEKDLFILITDLYENQPYESQFIKSIREAADLGDGKAFGLVGIQSGYQGVIRDIGPYGDSESYGEDGNSYRPVYVIVRGYPETVRDFCKELKSRLNTPDGSCEIFVLDESLQALDYRNFTGCKDYGSGCLWLDRMISINETESMDLYELQKRSGKQTLYFSFTVPEERRDAFQKLAADHGTLEVPNSVLGEQPMYRLRCLSQERTALWSKEAGTFEPAGNGDSFHIARVYYDTGAGNLYIALELTADRFSKGVWKLEWENTASQNESPWWKEWSYQNGSQDYSKTEQLQDCVEAMAGRRNGTLFLQGTIYLEVRD